MKTAKAYDQALAALLVAKTRHHAARGALDRAIANRDSNKVIELRRAAAATERALAEASAQASAAHRAHWKRDSDAVRAREWLKAQGRVRALGMAYRGER